MCNKQSMQILLRSLSGQPVLAERGFHFNLESAEELTVQRGTHLRGVWRCADGVFTWTPGGYSVPTHTVRNADDALRYTLVAVSPAT